MANIKLSFDEIIETLESSKVPEGGAKSFIKNLKDFIATREAEKAAEEKPLKFIQTGISFMNTEAVDGGDWFESYKVSIREDKDMSLLQEYLDKAISEHNMRIKVPSKKNPRITPGDYKMAVTKIKGAVWKEMGLKVSKKKFFLLSIASEEQ